MGGLIRNLNSRLLGPLAPHPSSFSCSTPCGLENMRWFRTKTHTQQADVNRIWGEFYIFYGETQQNALKMRTALRPLVEYPENSSQKRQRANSYGPSGCGPTPGNAHVMKKPGKGKLKGFWMTHIFPGEGPASVPSHMRLRTFHGPAIP